ncbi:pathogen-associated molecular patterns-induced protein A70 [Euphorbia lathyris]|uniref:pathogen-associated molecular patterns-induced protein A70 n=1 Tax=Euphorbia lathyris TaxID=212925 RepID=UPI003313FC6B
MLEESIWASMNSWLTPTVLFLFLNLMIGTIYVTSSLATHKHSDHHHHHADNNHQLPRSPSVLQRLKSVNFYTYRSPEPTTVTYEKPQLYDSHFPVQQSPEIYHQNQPFLSRSPSVLQRLKSINLCNYFSQESIKVQQEEEMVTKEEEQVVEEEEEEEDETIDEIYSKLQSNNKVSRSKSDTKPRCGEMPKKLPKKMRKSASSKSAFGNFEEEEIVETRRPATVREAKSKMAEVDDDEVDAKADDFINKFKQQLKLQRIDSIMRYKDMIHRGASKN